MRIGVDFDDVLYPYHHYLKLRLRRRFGIDLTRKRPTTFFYDHLPEFRARGVTRDEVWQEVRATWRETENHAEAALLDPDAVPVLNRLGRAHDVVIVSARSQDALPLMEAFLKRHRFHPRHIVLGRTEKGGFDLLIDDFPKHAVENADGGGYSLLYTSDENSTFDETRHPRIRRIEAWREVEPVVRSLERGGGFHA